MLWLLFNFVYRIRDDILSIRSRIPIKEVNRIIAKLKQDRLVCVYVLMLLIF